MLIYSHRFKIIQNYFQYEELMKKYSSIDILELYCFIKKCHTMFSPRFHGTTFNVIYGTSEAQLKEGVHSHLITSLDHFDIISSDWKEIVCTYSSSDFESVTIKKTLLILPLKNGEKGAAVYLDTRPEPCDHLCDALKLLLTIPNPEIRFNALSVILPSFNFTDNNLSMALHKAIMDQCSQLLATFHAPTNSKAPVSGAFVDLVTCAYRMRFDDQSAENIEKTTQEFALDITRYLLKAWCVAIARGAQASTTSKAPIYYSRLVTNMVETISIAANTLCISWDDLLSMARKFAENGEITGITSTAERVGTTAADVINQGFSEIQPYDRTNLPTLLNCVIIALSGLIVGMYPQDLDAFAAKAVEFTRAVINHASLDEPKQKLNEARQAFLTELLRFLDGERYDPNFQFVYCIWNLRNDDDLLNSQ
ncbi:hypothetical protein TRFO_26655 [Tritrichomonas foetus]|uniref:Uncharacterized protein n=1 Tax=Tritrichomonas foetus TaxID=1144522 RepID=A0A1J4K792_9EUKA|nr:hypothetical protein TRFO_26655 [Tritrichomonas foetus]|eukprot:OHT05580.1 hypothetical protein TRFO_26655 [Tritrichomonas foetus]